ncbi:hypothetical protein cypCar_00045753 [Cyprinus carpio]|nr:hypothetical protein cypCar_00045753 [Cyprinus carpio]
MEIRLPSFTHKYVVLCVSAVFVYAVTLSCSFKSRELISSSSSVTWSFLPEGEAVAFTSIFYYTGGKQFPGSVPQFESRVEWAGDMNKNDASIRVIQMQFKDNGTFSCDVKNPPDISGQMSFTKVRVVMKEALPQTSAAVIVGGVIGAVIGIIIIAVVTYLIIRRQEHSHDYRGYVSVDSRAAIVDRS